MQVRRVQGSAEYKFAYSICTLVSNPAEYEQMVEAFVRKGFTPLDCEYLYIDNSQGNEFDAYSGNNRFLNEARGRYIVLCHQDVLPSYDDRARLDRLLSELTSYDRNWAVCGNAGMTSTGEEVVRITDPYGEDRGRGGTFPAKVMSLDENLLVIRHEANLAFSRDLRGFHWYGSDVCILADILGWTAYVIDFHVRHKSAGNADSAFVLVGNDLQRKYARAFRPRWQFVVTRQALYLASWSDSLLVTRALRKVLRLLRISGNRQ